MEDGKQNGKEPFKKIGKLFFRNFCKIPIPFCIPSFFPSSSSNMPINTSHAPITHFLFNPHTFFATFIFSLFSLFFKMA